VMVSATSHRVCSTLQSLTASNNCQSKDLRFLCSGITLSYHQSILSLHSPFLSGLLASRACCQCNQAQCGKKEEVIIILDDVDVSTVQLLMEYLYKGECIVKDRRSFFAIKQLSNMLGFTMNISEHSEINSKEMLQFEESRPGSQRAKSSNGIDQNYNDDLRKFKDKESGSPCHQELINLCSVSVKKCNQDLESVVEEKKTFSPKQNSKKKSKKIESPDSALNNKSNEPAVLKKKGRKRKTDSVDNGVQDPNFDSNGEYTCFNPTFKIKPGTKKMSKANTGNPSVPEIQLTYNLGDQFVSQETIKLNDLSPIATKSKRRRGSMSAGVENQQGLPAPADLEIGPRDKMKRPATAGSSASSKARAVDTDDNPSNFSIHSLSSKASFPAFLRAVCDKVEALLPPGLDSKHSEIGRRSAHRISALKVQDNRECIITQDDILGEMMAGLETTEDTGNVSSDGSEGPLIMDLSEQVL